MSESTASFQPGLASGDNSTFTLTGSGTFELGDSHEVTGGGTCKTISGTTGAVASGTYGVTEFVSFVLAPGDLASAGVIDGIGNNADSHAGVAVVKVTYSDGEKGILVVVCSLPPVTPVNVIEGTTAIKGFVDYADPLGTDPNIGNTVFHVTHHED
jgi:hypothetical protein